MVAFICFVFLQQTKPAHHIITENAFYKRCVFGGIVCFRLAPQLSLFRHHIHLAGKKRRRVDWWPGANIITLWALWVRESERVFYYYFAHSARALIKKGLTNHLCRRGSQGNKASNFAPAGFLFTQNVLRYLTWTSFKFEHVNPL